MAVVVAIALAVPAATNGLMHVNDPDFFSERSVVVCSDDVDAFPSNNSHENTRSLHSAFAAKNDCGVAGRWPCPPFHLDEHRSRC